MEPNSVANWTLVGVAGAGGIFWMIRWIIRTFSVDKLALKVDAAHGGIIDSLRNEVSHLEGGIKTMRDEIRILQAEQSKLYRMLAHHRAGIIAIDALVDNMCDYEGNSLNRLRALIKTIMEELDDAKPKGDSK